MAKKKERDRSFLEINPDELDREWLHQPNLALEFHDKLADAKLRLDEKTSALRVTEAELAKAIRKRPEDYDLDKLTEAALKETVLLQPEYADDVAAMQEASHRVDLLRGTVAAISDRRRSLENLVELHLAGYYAEPRAKKRSKTEVDELRASRFAKYGKRKEDKD